MLSSRAGDPDLSNDYCSYWRKRRKPAVGDLPKHTEPSLDHWEDFKRLKLDDAPAVEEGGSTCSLFSGQCQAIVPYTLSLDEKTFKLTVLTDFSDSTLSHILKDGTDDAPEETEKQIIVYRKDPIAEMLQKAAYLDEHQMPLD